MLRLSHTLAVTAVFFTVLGGIALAQNGSQDKYAVRVPDGLGFADFRGYENWEIISTSEGDNVIAVIVGNPAMIAAFKAGVPANGGKFPDGAKMAKIHWTKTKQPEGLPGNVSNQLRDIDFMVKDAGRYAAGAGWGYAQFNYNSTTGAFTPLGRGAGCGIECHKAAAARDSVFSRYANR
jgi:hypothetical protein